MPATIRRRLLVALLILSFALQFALPVRAMTANEFWKLSDDGKEQYFQDMIALAQKLLRDAGKTDDAELMGSFADDGIDEYEVYTGRDIFSENLSEATYAAKLRAVKDPAIQQLQVEFTFVKTLEEFDIELPDTFLQIAKAGKIHSTVLATRYDDIERQFGPGIADFASSIAALVGEGRPTNIPSEVRRDVPPPAPQAPQYQPGLIADMNPGFIGRLMVLSGTVSRVEARGGFENLFFREAWDYFAVCFPANTFQGLAGLKDYSELVGRTVEVRGRVTPPGNCGASTAAMEISVPTQITVSGNAVGALAGLAKRPVGPAASPPANATGIPGRQRQAQQPPPVVPQQVKPSPAPAQPAGLATSPTDSADAAAAHAKAAQERQERAAQLRAANEQRLQEIQEQTQKIGACAQQLTKNHPDANPGDPNIQKEYLACMSQAIRGSNPAAATQLKALQEQQDRAAEQRAAAQQASQERVAEAQKQVQKATACMQEFMKNHPDGARSDPTAYQKEYVACLQAPAK